MTPSCFSLAAAFVLLCRPIKTSKIGVKVAGHRLCLCVSPVCRTFCDDDRGLRQPGSLGRLRYGAMACETKLTKYTRLPALFDARPGLRMDALFHAPVLEVSLPGAAPPMP